MAKGLSKIFLTLSFVMFPPGITAAHEAAESRTAAGAGAAIVGDQAQTRRRVRRRRAARRTTQRGQRMTQPKDNSQPQGDAARQDDAAEQKKADKIGEAGKIQPPVPRRPRRRYDPVLQPPEKTRVP